MQKLTLNCIFLFSLVGVTVLFKMFLSFKEYFYLELDLLQKQTSAVVDDYFSLSDCFCFKRKSTSRWFFVQKQNITKQNKTKQNRTKHIIKQNKGIQKVLDLQGVSHLIEK